MCQHPQPWMINGISQAAAHMHNIHAHIQTYMCAHALQHTNMCTRVHTRMQTYSYTHMHRILHTRAWILEQSFNASHSLRLELLSLCSYHSISLNRSAVTMMTQCLPFYLKAVYQLKLHPLISWDKSIRLIEMSTEHSVVLMFSAGLWSSWGQGSGLGGTIKWLRETWPWHWGGISQVIEAKWM